MWHLYIIKCSDGTLYTGITTNLARRIQEHNISKKGAKYTSTRRPVKLVYSKTFKNRSLSSKAEALIKKLTKLEKENLIKEKLVYNIFMAKRKTGPARKRASRSKKTPKRLAVKHARLSAQKSKSKKKK